jgi:branched-chain amino acid transport system substrate-binding protein
MTYERQAGELAEYASGVLGLQRFGILYPRDAYGMALSQAFRDQVQRRGGQVVGTLAYSPKAEEFSVELLTVQKWAADDGLQAVFIPDFAATAVALGTALRRAQPNLVLLGSNGWNDPAQLGSASQELNGAVFVDGFFAGSQRTATRDFVAAYQAAYHSAPQILEAQGYDAATLVRRALEAGARSRAEVIPALQAMQTLDGAAGTLGVGPQGVQRQLFLLRLGAGNITEIIPGRSPAPPKQPVTSASPLQLGNQVGR